MPGDPCARCGRLVVDETTDFGGAPGLLLRPTCAGLEAVVEGVVVDRLVPSELRAFLDRAYGEHVPADGAAVRRASAALDRFDGRAWAGASRYEVVRAVVAALRADGS